MKKILHVVFCITLISPLLSMASEYSEDEVLHATFAAFQEPGVFSEQYIRAKRQLLIDAATEGNMIASLVIYRFGVLATDREQKLMLTRADNHD